MIYKYFIKQRITLKIILKKIIKKFIKELIFFLFLVFFTPFLYLNRLLPQNIRLYFAGFRSERIGHFMTGFQIRYAQKKLGINKKNCIYYFNDFISNKFIAKQVRENFPTNRLIKYIVMVCERLPFLDCLVDREIMNATIDKAGLNLKTGMPPFTNIENEFCFSWLKQNGWEGPKQKIVCIHVRDSAYLTKYFNEDNQDYHSVRDANIDDFNDVIHWLIKKRYFVVRTGKVAKKKLKVNYEFLVDYPFINNQNDLLDIWLMANSSFVISSSSGLHEVPYGFNVPVIYVNFLPLGQVHSWKKSLVMGKHLIWEDSNEHLNLEEYIKIHNYHGLSEYKKLKIKIKDLSKEEILETVKDGYSYFVEKKPFKKDDLLLTNQFKKAILKSKSDIRDYHEFFNPKFVLSSNLFKFKKF